MWDAFDGEALYDAIRAHGPAADAARTVWGFEHALALARRDPELLRHVLVACVCLVAVEDGDTPRTVLERLFRRSVADAEWRDVYEPLFA